MHKSEVPQTPFRVLQVLTAMNRGGAETMVMNHYRAIDRNKVAVRLSGAPSAAGRL